MNRVQVPPDGTQGVDLLLDLIKDVFGTGVQRLVWGRVAPVTRILHGCDADVTRSKTLLGN